MQERRRQTPGRRDSDRILDALWRELDAVERSRERDRSDLRGEIARLERALMRLEEHLEGRVDDLEEFHITERTKVGLQVAERTENATREAKRLGAWQKVAIAFGVLGTTWGIVATVIHL